MVKVQGGLLCCTIEKSCFSETRVNDEPLKFDALIYTVLMFDYYFSQISNQYISSFPIIIVI